MHFTEMAAGLFWISLIKVILIDLVLSGDNAVVIAMACRDLPPKQRKIGIALGATAAALLRIFFTGFLAYLLEFEGLKIVGAIMLVWVAVKMLIGDDGGEHSSAGSLWSAVGLIVVADAAMSLDNVIAVSAAAAGDPLLVIIGLALSIPLVVLGASLISLVIERFPLVIWAAAFLLGYIAGEMFRVDPFFGLEPDTTSKVLSGLAGGLLVIGISGIIRDVRKLA